MAPALSAGARVRLPSLDVFRGVAVASMILVNNPGSWQHLYAPLAHARWHGWTATDLVFPFFLFAVGNALALTAGAEARAFWPRWLRRTVLVFAIGLLLNAAPFVRWSDAGELVAREWHDLRVMGVLQRIALAWAAAALIVRAGGARGAWWASVALLLGYWAACVSFGRPGDPYSLEGFFGTSLDRQLLGAAHLHLGEGVPFDPEGLASTLPAIAQVLLGYLVGQACRTAPGGAADRRLLLGLAWGGAAALVGAALWSHAMPINKKLWTSSYVLLTTGWAMLVLALIAWLVARRGRRGLVMRFLEAYGQNALFIFVLSSLLPRVWAVRQGPRVFPAGGGGAAGTAAPLASMPVDPRLLSLLVALAHVAVYGLIAWWLARRRVLIRL